MKEFPEISVVMSVYNGQKHLKESIKSILEQTYADYEFIIINDGSSDNSKQIIDGFARLDKRIVVAHQPNLGLTKSLNIGVGIAKGKFIARQDADDFSLADRLEMQVSHIKRYPETVLCGTWFEEVNEGCGVRIRRYPVSDGDIRKNIQYTNLFCHPSVMFSRDAFEQAGKYDEMFTTGQDFELWVRLAKHGQVANLPIVLVRKRIGFGKSISWERRHERRQFVWWMYKKHFRHQQRVHIVKFVKYYLPLLIYPLIPVCLVRLIRRLRYRPKGS